MVKRKTSGSGELRTSSIPLSLMRYSNINSLRTSSSYMGLESIQPFFPPIESLFKTDDLSFVHEYGIKFPDSIIQFGTGNKVILSSGKTVDIHAKKTMILSPFKWMSGDFGTNISLPTSKQQSDVIHAKLQNPHTAGYVGSIISSILSISECRHFPTVYGVYSGMSIHHKIDISDDYEEVSERPWFTQNIGKTFDLELANGHSSSIFKHTRTQRGTLQLGDDIVLEDIQTIDPIPTTDTTMADIKPMFEDDSDNAENSSDSSSISTEYIFNIMSCDCSENENSEEGEDESGEGFAHAIFRNVPIQATIMEKCEGTLYELMCIHPETDKHLAWISQVIFGLAFAQRNFAFTHNDLHSNNVMYVKTDEEYFYYSHTGQFYKVPTHGYLIKIIDFDRSIASIKLTGMKEPKLFMSDQFGVMEEAGGQYNYGPSYHAKHSEIKPNPSFDLVRLATSMFWDLFPEGPKHEEYTENIVFQMLMRWLTLEDGTSIFFGKKEPEHERYHGFHLYKAIARYCKDNAIPRKEISNLKMFLIDHVPTGESCLHIEV